MTRPRTASGTQVLAYDGDCGFCQASVDRIRRSATPAWEAVPWQSLPDRLTAPHLERLDREVLLLRSGTVVAGGADALLRYVGSSPYRSWRTLSALAALPGIRGCARLVYRWVARNRLRMPGGTAACAVPARPR
ncbi:thiol-disulfide oxidoreductase DCC family protein [Streptomyces sp. NPDC053367]|uniref:thiol-disulfide oxidoreductase DCC family protein n=1 Tax=Streptomyces sp. NPDC053367 TaxID=3365700 RepID=UPI0037D317CE